MYKFHYEHREVESSDDYDNSTTLTAVFDFSSEASKKDKAEVKKRFDFRTRMEYKKGIREQEIGTLNRYLFDKKEATGFEVSNTLFQSQSYRSSRTFFTISPLRFGLKLGIKLKVEASGHLPLEEMFDLDSLNHFILTGETDYREQQSQLQLQLQNQQT